MIGSPRLFALREYRAEDAPALARLFFESVQALGPRRYGPAQVAAWAPAPADPASVHARASDGRTTIVAVNAADEIIGYADLEPDGQIDHFYRRPDAAGAGVAPALMDELLGRAAATGMSRLYAAASDLARGLFTRKGFVVVARRDFELRGQAIHNWLMERQLDWPTSCGRSYAGSSGPPRPS